MQGRYESVVVVTGAGRRLGAALVRHLLMQGYTVLASYRHDTVVVEQLRALGAIMVQADLSSDQGAIAFAQQVEQRSISLRAIIHNASLWYDDATLSGQPSLRDATFALHVFTPYLLNQQLASLLRQHQGLRDIIFISDASSQLGKADKSLYLASKAAMDSLMRSQAIALAPDIKVNVLAPGLLAFHEGDAADYQAQRLSQSLMGCVPGFTPALEAIDYLLESRYSTASRLVLDGGLKVS